MQPRLQPGGGTVPSSGTTRAHDTRREGNDVWTIARIARAPRQRRTGGAVLSAASHLAIVGAVTAAPPVRTGKPDRRPNQPAVVRVAFASCRRRPVPVHTAPVGDAAAAARRSSRRMSEPSIVPPTIVPRRRFRRSTPRAARSVDSVVIIVWRTPPAKGNGRALVTELVGDGLQRASMDAAAT